LLKAEENTSCHVSAAEKLGSDICVWDAMQGGDFCRLKSDAMFLFVRELSILLVCAVNIDNTHNGLNMPRQEKSLAQNPNH